MLDTIVSFFVWANANRETLVVVLAVIFIAIITIASML